MTADLKGLRAQVKGAFTVAGFAAFTTKPEVAVPPLIFVTADEDYVTPGGSFGGLLVNNQITLVAPPGVNEMTADALDDMIAAVIDVIEDVLVPADVVGNYQVGRPGSIELEGQAFLAVAISTQTEIRRNP